MKVKRMLAIERNIFDRLMILCEKEGFYRNSFIIYVLSENMDKIKDMKTNNVRVRNKEKKVRFQIYIDLDLYESIGKGKTRKIEKILDEIIGEYEKGIRTFK